MRRSSLPEFAIGFGGGALDEDGGADEAVRRRQAADGEVRARARRLHAIVRIGRDAELTERIALDAGGHEEIIAGSSSPLTYSPRSAIAGSTSVACRAGSHVARSAMPPRRDQAGGIRHRIERADAEEQRREQPHDRGSGNDAHDRARRP